MPTEDSKSTAEEKPLKLFNPYEKYTPDEIRAFNETYFEHLLQETQISGLEPTSDYDKEGNPIEYLEVKSGDQSE
ncbi:hypothetical protein [uncultured Helicobacter sp.]|uniref:hypothetical protein n=1 Tax=uncultured Helicobacter sp. TaxID=175537 RepID=UPI00260F63F1|nr:hypothetical protein [uncultured Helicobacter sp.]